MFVAHALAWKIVAVAVIDAVAITLAAVVIETPAIVAICGVFVALFSVVGVIFNGVVTLRTQKILIDQTGILHDVKTNTDGMSTALAKSAKSQGLAEGALAATEAAAVLATAQSKETAEITAVREAEIVAAAEARTPATSGPTPVQIVTDDDAPLPVKVVDKKAKEGG